MASPPLLVADDRYELIQVVGEGGFGRVYRGLDRRSGERVAVKVLSPEATADPERIERMVREQQAMVSLAGQGTVGARDLCKLPSGQLCLVMEWLEGEDLEQHLERLEKDANRLSHDRLLNVVSSVANTLDRAHQIGIVHRDIKPGNIFLPDDGSEVRILDFGLSRMRWSKTLTQGGMVMGSPSYIAPETWLGDSNQLDHRVDLYALGVIVFRAVSGQLPFPARSLAEQLQLATHAPRPSLRRWRPDLGPGIDRWAAKALAVDPDERFQSGRELYLDLGLALGEPAEPLPKEPERAKLPDTLDELQEVAASAWSAAAGLLKRLAGLRPSSRPPPRPVPHIDSSGAPTALSLTQIGESDEEQEERKSYVSEWLASSHIDESKKTIGFNTLFAGKPQTTPASEAKQASPTPKKPARANAADAKKPSRANSKKKRSSKSGDSSASKRKNAAAKSRSRKRAKP